MQKLPNSVGIFSEYHEIRIPSLKNQAASDVYFTPMKPEDETDRNQAVRQLVSCCSCTCRQGRVRRPIRVMERRLWMRMPCGF